MSKPARILIVDDHMVVRMGLVAMLGLERDLRVIGEAGTGDEAVLRARELNPDVVVMDLVMPQGDGIGALRRIRAEHPGMRVVIITSFATPANIQTALAAGAYGVVAKESSPEQITRAIQCAARGAPFPSEAGTANAPTTDARPQFTPRQTEILTLVAKGFTTPETAQRLGVGPDCVKAHLKTIFAKLNVATRSEAVATAIQLRLIDV